MLDTEQLIDWLKLKPNTIEGGFYISTYESTFRITDANLLGFSETQEGRPICSAIYYLLTPDTCSLMHRVTGDMLYHFYDGDPVQMLLLYPQGYPNRSEVCVFSNKIAIGGIPMKVIPGGTWLGSRLVPGGTHGLMGVTMAPGFHPSDYAIGLRDDLIEQYKEHEDLITKLTRE